MKFNIIFVFALLVVIAFNGCQTAPNPRWKGWRKIERAGQRVFKAAEKALPVIQGYSQAYKLYRG